MEKIKCPICSSSNFKHFKNLKDRFEITNDIFLLVKCECDFVYLNPRPNQSEISKYYKHNQYHSHFSVNFLYKLMQFFSFRWKYNIIKKHLNFKFTSILDYGSGKGEFSNFLTNKDYQVDNYEPLLKNEKYFSDHKFLTKKYQLITLWHSLEHIHDINESLNLIYNKLESKGRLFIAVPNLNAVEKKYFDIKWAPYDAPRHLYHFTSKTLSVLLNKHNFKIIEEKNMYQDTIYNIYLSLSFKNPFSFIVFIYLSFICLIKSIFFNKNSSSSKLYICVKK